MAHGKVPGDKGWSLPTTSADDRGSANDKVPFHAYTSWLTSRGPTSFLRLTSMDGVFVSEHELRAEAKSGILGMTPQGLRAG